MRKSDRVRSEPGRFGEAATGENSEGDTEVVEEDDHQPTTQEASPDLPTCGLLRMEERLWLLASEMDLVRDECDGEEELPRSKLVRVLFTMDLPVKEG